MSTFNLTDKLTPEQQTKIQEVHTQSKSDYILDCYLALKATNWDVQKAIKILATYHNPHRINQGEQCDKDTPKNSSPPSTKQSKPSSNSAASEPTSAAPECPKT